MHNIYTHMDSLVPRLSALSKWVGQWICGNEANILSAHKLTTFLFLSKPFQLPGILKEWLEYTSYIKHMKQGKVGTPSHLSAIDACLSEPHHYKTVLMAWNGWRKRLPETFYMQVKRCCLSTASCHATSVLRLTPKLLYNHLVILLVMPRVTWVS